MLSKRLIFNVLKLTKQIRLQVSTSCCVQPGILIGCGNPLLDISAVVDLDFLKKYNLKPNDAIIAGKAQKLLYNDLIEHFKTEYLAGGSVQNSLRVCQWILQVPNITVFFGCVGADRLATILEHKARSDGVDVEYQVTLRARTGTCTVLITGQDRSLCANLAAAEHFTIDHLHKEKNRQLIKNAKYFYCSGFFLTVSPPSTMEMAQRAHKTNGIFILNLSAPFVSQLFMKPLEAILPFVDILFGNESEADMFALKQGWDVTDRLEIGRKIQSWPKENPERKRIVVITQGPLPVLVIQEDSVMAFDVESVANHDIVDTNGAGDAFVGGFLAQLLQDKPLDVSLRCGTYAAQHILKHSGCTFTGKPEFEE